MAAIKTRELGNTGIEVTRIGVGLWAIGGGEWGQVRDRESLDMIDAALDMGINRPIPAHQLLTAFINLFVVNFIKQLPLQLFQTHRVATGARTAAHQTAAQKRYCKSPKKRGREPF